MKQKCLAEHSACFPTVRYSVLRCFLICEAPLSPELAFPGIWCRYHGVLKKDGPKVAIEVYALLTTTPNKLVATVNHVRMPVLLTREEEFDVWLNGSPHVAFALAKEYPPG